MKQKQVKQDPKTEFITLPIEVLKNINELWLELETPFEEDYEVLKLQECPKTAEEALLIIMEETEISKEPESFLESDISVDLPEKV